MFDFCFDIGWVCGVKYIIGLLKIVGNYGLIDY